MKKIFIIIFITAIFMMIPVSAASQLLGETTERVYDYAGLLTNDEINNLENKIQTIISNYNIDVVIVTLNENYSGTPQQYADDFFDYNGFGFGEEKDGVLFFIDIYNRETWISTSGSMRYYLTDSRQNYMWNEIIQYLSNDDFYNSSDIFVYYIDYYINEGIPEDAHLIDTDNGEVTYYYETSGFYIQPELIIISLIVALFVALSYILVVRNRYKLAGSTYSYDLKKNTKIQITAKSDVYVRTDVVKTRKSSNNGSSGGGRSSGGSSVHRSSSGSSHGGSGRKF